MKKDLEKLEIEFGFDYLAENQYLCSHENYKIIGKYGIENPENFLLMQVVL